jgi:RecA-family ATPase
MSAIVSGADYLNLPRAPHTWLIEPIIPMGGSVLMYGDAKVGKSYSALQLAMALQGVEGDHWLGFPVRHTGPVVYVQLDTPRSLWAERLIKLRDHGAKIDQLNLSDRETIGAYPFDILDPTHATILSLALRDYNPVAVIIDTIREFHQLDEDKSTDMKRVISALTAAVDPAALILIAHARKPGQNGYDLLADNRGSSYVVGRMDSIIRFSKKHVYYTGRAIEEGSLKLGRDEVGFWTLDDDSIQIDLLIAQLLPNPAFPSIRAKAAELARLTGKSEEAARSLLRRAGGG